MRELFLFAIGASVVGTVFFVSLIELLFTIQRRKINHELEAKIREMRANYNTSMNQVVMEDEKKIDTVEEEVKELTEKLTEEKEIIEKTYEEKIESITKHNERALDTAKEKAKRLEHEAKQKAEQYLASRKEEVEEELMDLVISVTKKVLPQGITYEAQKELVMHALADIRSDNSSKV